MNNKLSHIVASFLLLASSQCIFAGDVRGKVQLGSADSNSKDISGVVVSLTAVDEANALSIRRAPAHATLQQKNKEFVPHVLVVAPGSEVQFPNRDPFFHNVFSLFEGKRFDLGLYEAGSTRSVKFDRPGVSYIFCNIHPQMSAIVIALNTPYYSIADKLGTIKIFGVPPGDYTMQIWAEGLNSEEMRQLSRRITLTKDELDLGTVHVPSVETLARHKNKYGRDYDIPTPQTEYEPR